MYSVERLRRWRWAGAEEKYDKWRRQTVKLFLRRRFLIVSFHSIRVYSVRAAAVSLPVIFLRGFSAALSRLPLRPSVRETKIKQPEFIICEKLNEIK